MSRVENPARAVGRSYRSLLLDLGTQPSGLGLFEAGEAARRLGEYSLSESLFRRCIEVARSECDKSTMAWGFWGLATLERLSGNFDAAVTIYRRSASCAVEAGNADCLNWARAGQAEIVRHRRKHSAAITQHEALAESFLRAGDAVGQLWAIQGVGQVHLVNGSSAADDFFLQADDLAQKIGDLRALGFSRRALGMSARLRGNIPRATELLNEAGQIFRTLEYQVGMGFVSRELAHCELVAGHLSEAERLVREALERFGRMFPLGRAWALATFAQIQKQTNTANETTLLSSAQIFQSLGVDIDPSEDQATYMRRFFLSSTEENEAEHEV